MDRHWPPSILEVTIDFTKWRTLHGCTTRDAGGQVSADRKDLQVRSLVIAVLSVEITAVTLGADWKPCSQNCSLPRASLLPESSMLGNTSRGTGVTTPTHRCIIIDHFSRGSSSVTPGTVIKAFEDQAFVSHNQRHGSSAIRPQQSEKELSG